MPRGTVLALWNKATVEGSGEGDIRSDIGLPILLSVSKQPAIMPGQSYGLEDGSSSYKDFSESRNNRFSTPEQAAKNRIQHPSNVLHFFNAPLEVTEENFFEICDELGVKRPSSVKVFSGKSEWSAPPPLPFLRCKWVAPWSLLGSA